MPLSDPEPGLVISYAYLWRYYGFLPPRLFEKVKAGILDSAVKRRLSVTNRD